MKKQREWCNYRWKNLKEEEEEEVEEEEQQQQQQNNNNNNWKGAARKRDEKQREWSICEWKEINIESEIWKRDDKSQKKKKNMKKRVMERKLKAKKEKERRGKIGDYRWSENPDIEKRKINKKCGIWNNERESMIMTSMEEKLARRQNLRKPIGYLYKLRKDKKRKSME